MSIIGAHIVPAVPGLKPADRAAERDKRLRREPDGQTRAEDVVNLTAGDAVRGLEGNDQEEAHEDRQAHQQYAPGGFVPARAQARSLDVQG